MANNRRKGLEQSYGNDQIRPKTDHPHPRHATCTFNRCLQILMRPNTILRSRWTTKGRRY